MLHTHANRDRIDGAEAKRNPLLNIFDKQQNHTHKHTHTLGKIYRNRRRKATRKQTINTHTP